MEKLQLAIAKANRALDPSDNGDAMTADELQSTADELQKTVESVVSAGLPRSNPLVKKATKLSTDLRNMSTEVSVARAFSRCIRRNERPWLYFFVLNNHMSSHYG